MNLPDKNIYVQTFTGGVDSDTSNEFMPADRVRSMENCRVFRFGEKGVLTNVLGNTLIENNFLPSGNNTCIGWGKNEEEGKLYYFNYNDTGYHGIYCFDSIKRNITPVILNLTDTNNVDILKFNKDFLINHVDLVQDNLIYWVDGYNKARKFNINKAIDKSSTGYGTVITEDFITAYKQTAVYSATVVYFTDLTRSSNYLYALQFKFVYRFYYDDNEISNFSDWSAVPLPPNQSYLGQQAITFDNNGIYVTVQTGSKLVTKIEIGVKINDLDFVGCAMLNKAQLQIPDNAVYTYYFYNDGSYWTLDQSKIIRPYSFLPRTPYCQSFVKVAMTYGRFFEGFETIQINAKVDISYKPFYLPSGTVSQYNNPLFNATEVSITSHGGLFNNWWTSVYHFEVGVDVKKGNNFILGQYGGGVTGDFNYPANLSDTATTVASKIKAYLRGLDAGKPGVVFGETTDGFGNVIWDFTIDAHEGKDPFRFFPSVAPVNYSTLLDNGLSINTIKMGSPRKYAIVYEDDDGRTSLAYTDDALLAKTQFETETLLGQTTPLGLQQPIHKISIFNQPPIWAKYWRLVRTNDITGFIQLLIQQVNTVTVVTSGTEYLDLVVGSLFTYQKIHPDTILKYEFQRGDRLRLISNENTVPATLYTPYFETEVLSYSTNTEQLVNANITTTVNSDVVTITTAADPNYVGKDILINNYRRTIISASGNTYTLDEPVVDAGTFPNYSFIDNRGIIRINKPPSTYNVASQSLVELYHPPANTNEGSYQDFYDFQQKFEVSDWGTPTRAHRGNLQDQDGTNATTLIATPAIVQVTQGDAYVRNRAMPSNNSLVDTQVIVDRIADPNFSDFYQSNLYDTGRVYPQDQGYGTIFFDSRIRFSNNYIEDTRVNGLNDFDNLDRKDYNDPHGSITLTRFRKNYLFVFKQFKSAWTPVLQKIIVDNAGNQTLATSDDLLNDLRYAEWEGGIGNNGEGWTENGDYQYIPSANSGVFLRIAQDGSIPISSLYNYDSRSRELLSYVNKYNLRIFGGFDRLNNEAQWSINDFITYLYNNQFNAGDWQTIVNSYPTGTTFTITQQPANSIATVVGNLIEITGTTILGNDFFKFQGNLPGGGTTPILNFCFEVIENPVKNVTYVIDGTSAYCLLTGPNNNGQQGWKILDQVYQVSGVSSGFKMPNIVNISPDAIVPLSATITFNLTNITPSGGSNGDIWYNSPADALFKNISGVWATLTNKVINAYYQPSIYNPTECPIPPSAIGLLFVDVFTNTTANLYAYIDTAGATVPYQQPVYTGNNFFTNLGVVGAANCYELASDLDTDPTLKWRFALNITKLINDYPLETTFTFIIAGRDVATNTLTGAYVLKNMGTLIMTGSPGTYLPSDMGGGLISSTPYTSNPMMTGANGTYGIGIGAPILTFVYDVPTNAITLTI